MSGKIAYNQRQPTIYTLAPTASKDDIFLGDYDDVWRFEYEK